MTYKLENIKRYLEWTEWRIEAHTKDLMKATKLVNGQQFQIVIPNNEALDDYELRVKMLADTLSDIEGENKDKILNIFENLGYDFLDIHIQNERVEKAIPITTMPQIFVEITRSIRSIANMAISDTPKPKYGKSPLAVDELLEKSTIESLAKGSVLVTVKIPSKFESEKTKDIVEKVSAENLGRKTITTFTKSLASIKTLDFPAVDIVNKNLCDSL